MAGTRTPDASKADGVPPCPPRYLRADALPVVGIAATWATFELRQVSNLWVKRLVMQLVAKTKLVHYIKTVLDVFHC